MCGFAGIFSRGPDRAGLASDVKRMALRLRHRGPDDAGEWVDQDAGVALGFRRLSIIDLSACGHQPMSSASGRFTLVYNGEVYNYREIRRELEDEADVAFRGHSDTEVILAAFERWGIPDAVRRFVGMFSIAVWDARERRLSLIRDRLGIKPLYVYQKDGLVLFGSELKALLAHDGFDRGIDPAALTEYFRLLYVPQPRSIFAHARQLPAGTILTLSNPADAQPAPEPYWSLADVVERGRADPFRGGDEELLERVDEVLAQAVRLRMRSDVPFGALLSGGIDSSLVTAVMQEQAPHPIKTFCIGFDEARFDESAHAGRVAAHLGTDHTEVRLTGEDALATLPRVIEMFDEPFANPSNLPTLLVCEVARRHVTVALAGDGGDEVFGGYNRYLQGQRAITAAVRQPRALRRALGRSVGLLNPGQWTRALAPARRLLPSAARGPQVGERLLKISALLAQDDAAGMYRSLLSAWQKPETLVRGGARQPDSVDLAFARGDARDLMARMQLADQLSYLPGDLLTKVDRVSMAVSLEVRVPLIDHNLVELAWRLPTDAMYRDGQGKWALRQLLHRRVPRSIVDRPKMGFTVPLDRWLRGPLREWVGDLLSPDRIGRDPLIEARPVADSWQQFLGGAAHLAPAIWAVAMYEAWRETWL
jgi:asparagine synthase (glutamine-hydrolysing)